MYEVLAKYYDELIDVAYYEKWKDFVAALIGERKNGADVGCGSGIFTLDLIKRGKNVIGLDDSEQMLERAYERALGQGVKAVFAKGRAEKLELPRKVEFVTALNDVANYMKDPRPFFEAAAENLCGGGLLLFDVSSEYKFSDVLSGHTYCLESENTVCVWQNSRLKKGAVDMNLKLFHRGADGRYSLEEESQRQYAHSEEKLKEMLTSLGFKVKVYADLKMRAPTRKSLRLHFAAEKGRGNGR